MPDKQANHPTGDRAARQEFSEQNKPAVNDGITPTAQVKLEGHAPIVGAACHLRLVIDSATTWGEWPLGEVWQWEFAGLSNTGLVHWRRLRIGADDPIIIRAEPRHPPVGGPVRVSRPKWRASA
jgi:hypothetical protein